MKNPNSNQRDKQLQILRELPIPQKVLADLLERVADLDDVQLEDLVKDLQQNPGVAGSVPEVFADILKHVTPTITPEFRKANGFVFQSISSHNRAKESAYYETLDDALLEIDHHAFAIPAQAGLSIYNPQGCCFRADIISLLVENLHQHEMPPGGALYYRSFLANEPVFGLRIEFWGAGIHPLPKALTASAWFTARNSPCIPKADFKGGGVHTALSDIFYSVEQAELAEVVYLGWREANKHEGPVPGGHVIAIHFAVESSNRD